MPLTTRVSLTIETTQVQRMYAANPGHTAVATKWSGRGSDLVSASDPVLVCPAALLPFRVGKPTQSHSARSGWDLGATLRLAAPLTPGSSTRGRVHARGEEGPEGGAGLAGQASP